MAVYWFLILLTTINFAHNTHIANPFKSKYNKFNLEDKEKISDYTGAQVLKIKRCPELIKIAQNNELNVWSGNVTHVDIMLPKKNVGLIKSVLSKFLIPYEVMIEDVDSLIKMHLHGIKLKNIISQKKDHRMTWTNYHRLDVIYQYMEYLADKYPRTVTVDVMGRSNGGRPLKYCKVTPDGNNGHAKAVFIDGGIHAREWISTASVTYILKTLVEDRSQLSGSLQNLEYYILPVMNPDGYEYSFTSDRLWRKNRSGSGSCIGTDLNRNFNFSWAGKGSSNNPCSEIYRGRDASSEPETKAVSQFILKLKEKINAYISFHSYGQLILIPFGFDYNEVPHDYDDLKRVGDSMMQKILASGGPQYLVGNSANTLYPASGVSDDWAKGVARVKYSYTIELRDIGRYGFMLPPEEIIHTAIDALTAFKVIASAVYEL
ncbi:carboxypeptidase B [Halyomorpha halys]|uniref:carboxypeptidase B n=1 Tax=Halyomorpha halys TaxID=286706 RepID=UPI0034D1E3CC